MSRKRRTRSTRGQPGSRVRRADKYELYQRSVQDPEGDVSRIRRTYQRHFGRAPRRLREDFCGSAALSCAWVAAHRQNRAWGIDLDPEPLRWARRHNLAGLRPNQAERVTLLEGDVLDVRSPAADVLVAFNFSFFLWKTRRELLRYFRRARGRLAREGLFLIDAYGGPEAQERREERRPMGGFTYVWDQDRFDPITHETTCLIHFEFPDRSRLSRAFRYDWRLWTLPELQELLAEAGFSRVEVQWEGTDRRTGEPNGVYQVRKHAEDDPAWVAYLVARR